MKKMIRVAIRRQDPTTGEAPSYKIYTIETERKMTVLEILQEIYCQWDATLAHRRYRCGRRICRSCEVRVEGQIVKGCAALLSPGKSYLLDPARPGSLIRDLVCAFDSPRE
jgi:succinate dehydrogenase/fumarate reductase-like Fe-S protein